MRHSLEWSSVYLLMVELNIFKRDLIICNSPFKHADIGDIFLSFHADASIIQFFSWGLGFRASGSCRILNLQICIECVVCKLAAIFVVKYVADL